MDRDWEPHWFVPADAIRAAQLLSVANLAQITNAFGACLAAEEVRITRNVVAHSLPATWFKLRRLQRQLGHRGDEDAAEFVMSRVGNLGPRHLHDWIADFKACLNAAIQ